MSSCHDCRRDRRHSPDSLGAVSESDPAPRRRTPPPPGTFRLGTIAGSDVYVTSSWFLVAALIAFVMEPRVEEIEPGLGGWKYVVGILIAVVLYLAVLL